MRSQKVLVRTVSLSKAGQTSGSRRAPAPVRAAGSGVLGLHEVCDPAGIASSCGQLGTFGAPSAGKFADLDGLPQAWHRGSRIEEAGTMQEKSWSVNIVIDEHENQTRATARLRAENRAELEGVGLARLNPVDSDVPEIGDELATARALADLAHQLIEVTAADIEKITKEPAHLRP